jgi:hypothetical protein
MPRFFLLKEFRLRSLINLGELRVSSQPRELKNLRKLLGKRED